MISRKYATSILDRLIALDKATMAAYYEMGQLLYAISEGALYDVLGYESLTHLIEEELTFSPSTAHRYRRMYAIFKCLHYNKAESLKLLREFGITHVFEVLSHSKAKLGTLAVKNRIAALNQRQVNFSLTDAEYEESERALCTLGAERVDSHLLHSSEAYLIMVRYFNKQKQAA